MPRRRDAPHPTSVRLSHALIKRLEKHAREEDRFLSVFIVRILEAEMDRLDSKPVGLPRFNLNEGQ